MNPRQTSILEMLTANRALSVAEIAQALSVSEVTVRKDVKHLSAQGLLRREHGLVHGASPDSIEARMGQNYEVKLRIARRAAGLVQPGETIMIESGSTCVLFAQALFEAKKDVTIITNSAFLAQSVAGLAGGRVVLLGGDYQGDSRVTTGPLLELCAREFHAGRLFIGVDGYTEAGGFSGLNYNRVRATRAMMASCDQLVVLTDSSKFFRQSVARSFRADEVAQLVTDGGIPQSARAQLERQGVLMIIA